MQNQKIIVHYEEFIFSDRSERLLLNNGLHFGPVTIRFETYGKLNKEKSNGILILHSFSSDSHAAGWYSKKDQSPGWWHDMIGHNRAFNTQRFFIVCSNVLGGCNGSTGPSSINPQTHKPYGLSFPVITIKDMVNAQYYLMQHLDIPQWYAVAGGSMGGMQALEWVITYPKKVQRTILIATTPSLSTQALAFNFIGRSAIMSDPHWKHGDYYQSKKKPSYGLSIARMLAHITYVSETSLSMKFGRKIQERERFVLDFEDQFTIESYLKHQGTKFVNRFDANTYLYLSKAMDYFDIAASYGSIESALRKSKSKFLIISFSSDWRFPPQASKKLVTALIRTHHEVSYVELECPFGHDCFLLKTEQQAKLIKGFLNA